VTTRKPPLPYFIARCNACKQVSRVAPSLLRERVEVGCGRVRIVYRYTLVGRGINAVVGDEGGFNAPCACGAQIPYSRMRGKLTDEPCTARCHDAYGARCECSCAGANHGRTYGGDPVNTEELEAAKAQTKEEEKLRVWRAHALSFPSLPQQACQSPETLAAWALAQEDESQDVPGQAGPSVVFMLWIWRGPWPGQEPLQCEPALFDLHAALTEWDARHRQTFAAWAADPIFF